MSEGARRPWKAWEVRLLMAMTGFSEARLRELAILGDEDASPGDDDLLSAAPGDDWDEED